MSKLQVQCKGSGKTLPVGVNAKRGFCATCGKAVDVTSTRKARKHTRIVSKSQLKRM